ncbi:hypothetical protein BKA65DRAFT_478828 [Rhexocercosporidium sp. MPI-PUGE-AT-0058]|nr:hypothetical protein BKA65DRAFT_478828 [Rhexocercosporidium sp. MPI-PUGE-AT-0058]
MTAYIRNIGLETTLPSIRDLYTTAPKDYIVPSVPSTPIVPTVPIDHTTRKKISRFSHPSERNLASLDQLIAECEDQNEVKELRRIRRILRNRQAAMDSRQRKRVRDAELEEVNNESQVSPWYSRYMGNDNIGGQGTYNVVCDPHAAALRVAIGSSVAAQQVTKSPRRMGCVTPADAALEKRRKQNREAQRACRKRVQAHMQELEQQLERYARLKTLLVSEQNGTAGLAFNPDQHIEAHFTKGYQNNGYTTMNRGSQVTGDHDVEKPWMKIRRFIEDSVAQRRESNHDVSSRESSTSQLKDSSGTGHLFPSLGRGNYVSMYWSSSRRHSMIFGRRTSELVNWEWLAQDNQYAHTIGDGTASIIHGSAREDYFPNTKEDGTRLQSEKPLPWNKQDLFWMEKDDQDISQRNDLQGYHRTQEGQGYCGLPWSRVQKILDRHGKFATALIFLARLTGAVASSTEPQPASPESLLETTILAACLGGVFSVVVYVEQCKAAQVLTPLIIVMPFACLDLGRDIAFPERQLLVVALFSASLNIVWLKVKLTDLPRTGGLTALLIATCGALTACGAAYYLPAIGGRYADRFILAAVSTLLTTMVWSVIWVVCFHNLGLAQKLEAGEYDEHIGAFTKRIFETWINQLITHACESLVSRVIGSNGLQTEMKKQAGDVESVPEGGLSRRESFWTAVDAPRTPSQSWHRGMSPSSQ